MGFTMQGAEVIDTRRAIHRVPAFAYVPARAFFFCLKEATPQECFAVVMERSALNGANCGCFLVEIRQQSAEAGGREEPQLSELTHTAD